MIRNIFLDSKDLINIVRFGEPMTIAEAREWLHKQRAQLVLSHTTVSEFVPVDESDRLRVRWELQQLESLPVTYIRIGNLLRVEVQRARVAHSAGDKYPTFVPFVDKFWRTFWLLAPSDGEEVVFTRELERRVAYRLDEQVFELWAKPDNFRNLADHTRRLQRKLSAFRADTRSRKERFRSELEDALDEPRGADFEPLAKWLQSSALRAPAWRLTYEVMEQWRANRGDMVKDCDLNDLAHVACLPFVDAATLDGRFVTYVHQATQRLQTMERSIDYDRRAFRSFREIIDRFEQEPVSA